MNHLCTLRPSFRINSLKRGCPFIRPMLFSDANVLPVEGEDVDGDKEEHEEVSPVYFVIFLPSCHGACIMHRAQCHTSRRMSK